MNVHYDPDPGEVFVEQVRDCLSHLYDYAAMQNDPVVQRLVPHLAGLEGIQAARKIMLETIELLNQVDSEKHSRLYTVLMQRYVEEQPTPVILQQLALSERQFYRDLNRAVLVLSQLLWERIHKAAPVPDTISIQTEIKRAYEMAENVSTDFEILLAAVIGSVSGLAEQREIAIRLTPPQEAVWAAVPLPILRQAIIYMVTEAIKYSAPRSAIWLQPYQDHSRSIVGIELTAEALDLNALRPALEQNASIAYLLQTMKAMLTIGEIRSYPGLDLYLPQHHRTILVIDDNPDVAELIARYLTNSSYVILSFQDPEEGIEAARKSTPFAIVLDVMMPNRDGWEILQSLKNHPDTCGIPVLVCSVLNMPELALSLGADCFLPKPPDRIELLKLLAQMEE